MEYCSSRIARQAYHVFTNHQAKPNQIRAAEAPMPHTRRRRPTYRTDEDQLTAVQISDSPPLKVSATQGQALAKPGPCSAYGHVPSLWDSFTPGDLRSSCPSQSVSPVHRPSLSGWHLWRPPFWTGWRPSAPPVSEKTGSSSGAALWRTQDYEDGRRHQPEKPKTQAKANSAAQTEECEA